MLKNILKINRPDFIELTTETKTVTSKVYNFLIINNKTKIMR